MDSEKKISCHFERSEKSPKVILLYPRKVVGYLFFFFLFSGLLLNGQDVDYARHCLEKLTSKNFHGRGYIKNGDLKAAKFVAGEFEKNGLQHFGNEYFQEYNFAINTFPSRIKIKLDKTSLIAGKDFVISCSNSSTNGIFNLVYIPDSINNDSLFREYILNNLFNENVVVVTTANLRKAYGKKIKRIKGVVILTEKTPWWHVSNGKNINETFWIKIAKEKFSEKPKTISVKFENEFIEAHQTQNIIAFVKGKKYPEKFFVFTAHYDHLGMMGNKAYFPGANDNGSGTSMLLDLARHYSQAGNQPDYSVAFMAFSGEEAGLHGSKFYANNPLFPLGNIKLLVNLDMVGTGSDGITVVNSSIYKDLLEQMRTINDEKGYLKQIKERGESCNSDHCPFYQKGVKSVFIYTMGKEHLDYHTIYDDANDFPFTAYNGLFKLLNQLVKEPL